VAIVVVPTIKHPEHLEGLWRHIARAFWLLTAAAMVAVFVIACFHIYRFYLTPCATWSFDQSCVKVVSFLGHYGFGVRWLAAGNLLAVVLVALPWMVVAGLLFAQRGHEVSGWLLSLALLTGWASDLTNVNVRHHLWWAFEGSDFSLGYLPHVAVYFVSFMSQSTIIMLAFLLPDGRFTPRWTFHFTLAWLLYMGFETFYRYPFLAAPAWFVWPETFFTFAAPLAAGYALWYRRRVLKRVNQPSGLEQKRQLETILPSVITLTLTYTLMTAALFILWRYNIAWFDQTVLRFLHDQLQNFSQAACAIWLSVSLGVAMFRHRLFALGPFVNRTLVYGGVTVSLLAFYLLIVFGVGYVLQQQTLWLSLVATSLIALLFQPLRERLQRRVNRLLYGRRGEPFELMRDVGEQVQALHPQDLLPGLVHTLHHTFRLPYVAITIYKPLYGQGPRTVTQGRPGGSVLRFPLVAQDELGSLEVSPRAYETLSETELEVLETIAKEIAVGARSLRLSLELQASRERLVTTREEERRRLRRDLHDSLGPTLAAQTLKIGAARSLLHSHPDQADEVLQTLEKEISGTLDYVRQLVYSLRPPLLDQLGLKAALEQRLREQSLGYALHLSLEVGSLPVLPAATEVAAYFIVTEAFQNVLRHAGATRCDIRVTLSGEQLELTIEDTGQGVLPFCEGVGLSSMRERCEELGGSLELSQTPSSRHASSWGQGVLVRARLPLHQQILAQSEPTP
jgi:signal transduction histidine kinase